MKQILVTGGTGFIGSQLVERLLTENKSIIILKRSFSDTWRIDHLIDKYSNNLTLLNIDEIELENIFSSYDIEGIFHLAASYIKCPTHEDIITTVQSNIDFPTTLLDLAVRNDVEYFINTGTFFEYSLNKLPLTESSKIDSLNFYSTSKISFENILKFYSKEYGIKASTLKLYTPYGPKDDENKIIPYLIIKTLKKEEVNINNPNNRLDIVHVQDIINAYIKVKENILNFNNYEVFNIAHDKSYSINEIYSSIKYNMNLEKKLNINEDAISTFSDTTKVKNMLNWEPKLGIDEGIKNTIEYYKEKYGL